ncbi:MAG TPA: DNA recombination protein RmuC, partial [Candidatus Baltobacteraceae bacterium]|nr:DNA recombination protein RmuC [Candidatus Baltobacteraceae bacterium]
LQAFAHGWRMQKQRDNVEKVAQIGKRLYDRMAKFAGMLAEVGTQLERTTGKYNAAVSSFTGRLIPSGRAMGEMLGAEDKLIDIETVQSAPNTLGVLHVSAGCNPDAEPALSIATLN